MNTKEILDKVVFIGPDIKQPGGIASVLRTYSNILSPFHLSAVNSHRGRIAGYLSLILLLVKMPLQRMAGRRIAHIHYASGKSWRRESRVATWARLCGLKVVMHCHSGLFPDYAKEHLDKVQSVLAQCVVNVVLSPKWSKVFEKELNIHDTQPINNVIQPCSTVHIATDAKRPALFVFIGDIIDRKGVFDLIEAADMIENKDWKIIICGNGDTERLEKRIASSPHKDNFEFLGVINPSERDALLSQADAVVLPSYFEGVPIVILEGMSAGTGVVATDVGAVSDLVNDSVNGFLVPPGDKIGIAQAMKQYIDNRNLVTEHATVSAERIKAYYPDAVRQSLIKLYKKILDGK